MCLLALRRYLRSDISEGGLLVSPVGPDLQQSVVHAWAQKHPDAGVAEVGASGTDHGERAVSPTHGNAQFALGGDDCGVGEGNTDASQTRSGRDATRVGCEAHSWFDLPSVAIVICAFLIVDARDVPTESLNIQTGPQKKTRDSAQNETIMSMEQRARPYKLRPQKPAQGTALTA